MKLDHLRLIFGADRPNRNLTSILHGPARNILQRIGTNGRLRQLVKGYGRRVQHDSGVKGQQSLRGSQQGIDVNFRNPPLFQHEVG